MLRRVLLILLVASVDVAMEAGSVVARCLFSSAFFPASGALPFARAQIVTKLPLFQVVARLPLSALAAPSVQALVRGLVYRHISALGASSIHPVYRRT